MNLLGYIVFYLVILAITFLLFRLITIIKRKTKKNLDEKQVQIRYIESRCNITIRERQALKLAKWIDLVNALGASIPLYIVLVLDLKMSKGLLYAMSVGLFLSVLLIGYNVIGIIVKKKENK